MTLDRTTRQIYKLLCHQDAQAIGMKNTNLIRNTALDREGWRQISEERLARAMAIRSIKQPDAP